MNTSPFVIAGRPVGPDHPPYIIAELSANHNGDLQRALAMIDVAKQAGADAVKLQTYTADTMTIDCDSTDFQINGGLWGGQTLHKLYQQAYTPWEWHEALFARGRALGIAVFSTPFDVTSLEFLEQLDPPAYKIASFELVDHPLIERVAATGKPMIMSTGMATLSEIEEGVVAARRGGCHDLILLHCISGYPTPAGEANLRVLRNMAETFGVAVGLSDHTLGTAVSVAACALGAVAIEKHYTMRRADGGPDSAFSLEPEELTQLVRECRIAHEALGRVSYDLKPSEAPNRVFRRSLYAVADIAVGEVFTAMNVRAIRPAYGLPPKYLPEILGQVAAMPILRGTALDWRMIGRRG